MQLFSADTARNIVFEAENNEKCVEQKVWQAIDDAARQGKYSVLVSVPVKFDKYIASRLTSLGFEARVNTGIFYSSVDISWKIKA